MNNGCGYVVGYAEIKKYIYNQQYDVIFRHASTHRFTAFDMRGSTNGKKKEASSYLPWVSGKSAGKGMSYSFLASCCFARLD